MHGPRMNNSETQHATLERSKGNARQRDICNGGSGLATCLVTPVAPVKEMLEQAVGDRAAGEISVRG